MVQASPPSHPKILENCVHFLWDFLRFLTTNSQSLSDAVRNLSRYLKEFTDYKGRLQACKADAVIA